MGSQIITCRDCGREMKHAAKGLCSACYSRMRACSKPKKVRLYTCVDCKKQSEAKGVRGPLPIRCDACARQFDSQRSAVWNKANNERHRENKRLSHHRHRERNNQKSRAYQEANRERVRKVGAEWRAKNSDRQRDYQLRKDFGITLDEYNSMLDSQGGACAICRSDEPGGRWGTFAVDHCHDTGAVRGLLCALCNTGLGCFRDSEESLLKAVEYLKAARLNEAVA